MVMRGNITIPTFVLTNKKHEWLVPGFAYLFNKYWPDQQPNLVSFGELSIDLPDNFGYVSIAEENFPAERWSDALITLLSWGPFDYVILLLEDYWLTEPVNQYVVDECIDYMRKHSRLSRILRMDLTADRFSKGKHFEPVEALESGTVIGLTQPGTPYQMSFQAAIWNVEFLKDILRPGRTPWECEVQLSEYLNETKRYVPYGTDQYPVRYKPVYRTHRKRLDISSLNPADARYIYGQGWLPR